jgi:hypothetical protein
MTYLYPCWYTHTKALTSLYIVSFYIVEIPSFINLLRRLYCESQSFVHSLLSQYRFCAGGVGLGAAYAMKYSKGPMPMVAAGVTGTMADMIYGYVSACQKEAQRFKNES